VTLQFRIQIKNINKPPVWRQVLVPETFTFEKFHKVIQVAFGWSDYHLYQFSPGGYGSNPIIAVPSDDDWDEPDLDASKTKLRNIFKVEKQKYTYIYDFGDDWVHSIVLEKILPEKRLKASCIAGKGACPPEDCGGPGGYERLKEILKNPEHEEYGEIREWIGLDEEEDVWDANDFDLVYKNDLLSEI